MFNNIKGGWEKTSRSYVKTGSSNLEETSHTGRPAFHPARSISTDGERKPQTNSLQSNLELFHELSQR